MQEKRHDCVVEMRLCFFSFRDGDYKVLFVSTRKCRSTLRKYLPFPNGVPSVSTMSRVLSAVDEEMVSLALVNWIGGILNTRGIHIAVDGKGLWAAARKVRGEGHRIF